MSTSIANHSVVNDGVIDALSVDMRNYATGAPFPHIVIDDFLQARDAESALSDFPSVTDGGWIHYVHVNERKHGLNKMALLPESVQHIVRSLNTPAFLEYLSLLTGIPKLLPDDSLEGGGLHQTRRKGFLNVHADFTVHPHRANWQRRVNLIIYLNKDWKPEYRGELELWNREMTQAVRKIGPLFNRCVIFNTDEHSFHGVPEPVMCPEEQTRKSIALYYFTESATALPVRATNYRARPEDGAKAILIWLDKQLVAGYTKLKRWLNIDDKAISTILNWFSRRK
jgi:Rps23 Pro-64 3,4-dihydroxylase Tpa1-like proline 4-hydroxylase